MSILKAANNLIPNVGTDFGTNTHAVVHIVVLYVL